MNDGKRKSLPFPSFPARLFSSLSPASTGRKEPSAEEKVPGMAEWFVTLTLKSMNEPVSNYNLNQTSSEKVCIVLLFLKILRKFFI